MLKNHDRTNFSTLAGALDSGHVALVEVQCIADGAVIGAICTVGHNDGLFELTPFATMVEGNPFDLFNPPNPDGDFLLSAEEGR